MERYKKVAGIVIALVALVALTGATVVFAQDAWSPKARASNGEGGHLAWDGPPGPGPRPGQHWMDQEIMHEAIAEALGIGEEELEAAFADGKTPFILAEELGVNFEEVQAAMQAARAEAVQKAIDDGTITEEQAEWMLSHQGGQSSQGSQSSSVGSMNRGQINGPAGGMGRAAGSNVTQPGDCQYQTP